LYFAYRDKKVVGVFVMFIYFTASLEDNRWLIIIIMDFISILTTWVNNQI
jgi:hypothetical protein